MVRKFNMLKYIWYAILNIGAIVISNQFAYGQNIYGFVTSDLKPLSGATIKNLNSKTLDITNENGKFELALKPGDTVSASYIGFNTETFIFRNQSPLLITLKAAPNMLGEVFIRANMSPLEKFKKNQANYKQIYRIGDDSHVISLAGGLGVAGIAINIDALYSALSKEGKDARRLQKTLIRDYHSDIVDSRFTKSLVVKLTGYEGQQLESFMINNHPSYEFIKNASDYDIIQYIKQKAGKTVLQKDTAIVAQK
jgi:hypothetical protein